jgi:hypothetical protein
VHHIIRTERSQVQSPAVLVIVAWGIPIYLSIYQVQLPKYPNRLVVHLSRWTVYILASFIIPWISCHFWVSGRGRVVLGTWKGGRKKISWVISRVSYCIYEASHIGKSPPPFL